MRLIISLLVIAHGLAMPEGGTRAHLIAWHQHNNLQTRSQEDVSYNPLQRRGRGRNKGKKFSSSSNATQSGKQVSKSQKKQDQVSSQNKVPLPEAGEPTEPRGRSRERLAFPKPSAPPLPKGGFDSISLSRQRSPSPHFVLSEPDVRGDGNRNDQGGAKSLEDTPSSPARSPSPVSRAKSPGKIPSSPVRSPSPTSRATETPASRSRSVSPIGSPPPPTAPLADRLRYLARLPSPPPRARALLASSSRRSPSPGGGPTSPTKSEDEFPSDDKFIKWIESMKDFSKGFRAMDLTGGRVNPHEIKVAEQAKAEAKRKKARADRSRVVAEVIGATYPATNPSTIEAMKRSYQASGEAVKAIKTQTAAQTAATFGLRGTSKHQDAVNLWDSSARQWIRAQSREAHRRAFATQHDAKVFKEIAKNKASDDPDRGSAFMNAAECKKMAKDDACHYYQRFKQYQTVKDAFPGGDSSSDEEWPLRDTPPERENSP